MPIFRPNQLAGRISGIDLCALREQGIRALLIDVDNTVAVWKGCEVPQDIERWLEKAASLGFRLAFISNSGTERLGPLAERLGAVAVFRAGKPRRRAFLGVAERLGQPHGRCAVIGDQLLTDVLGANRAGMHAILVNPLEKREYWGTKINRSLERILLAALSIRRPAG